MLSTMVVQGCIADGNELSVWVPHTSVVSDTMYSLRCRLDRINQVDLPLDGYYSSGDFDGRGVHGEGTGLRAQRLNQVIVTGPASH
jgi:hypothetical protein